MPVPEYVLRRLQASPPRDCCVVDGSTPVIAFGDIFQARVATVSLNPSNQEFLDAEGTLLTGEARRLATRESLGIGTDEPITAAHAEKIAEECAAYFDIGHNPYRRWFDQLEPILNSIECSYYDRSACHLDLVQWATDPKWGMVPAPTRRALLEQDVPFLTDQLRTENIRLVLVNGNGTLRHCLKALQGEIKDEYLLVDHGYQTTRVIAGTLLERVPLIGWSTNIQSSRGVTRERRRDLAELVCDLAQSLM